MSNGNVIVLDIETDLDVPPERVLSAALAEDLESAVVVGMDQNGNLYFAHSITNTGEILLLLEQAKMDLLRG